MKKSRKGFMVVICMLFMVLALAGCSTSMSYVYEVETGDDVEVKLDTGEGLLLNDEDGSFSVTEDDDTILQGSFVDEDAYEAYKSLYETADNVVEVIEEDSANGISWILYYVDGRAGMECDFIIWIDGSDTGVIMASLEDPDVAKEAFDSLSFSVK